MFELNTYNAEDYIIWTVMEEPETYAKKALHLSPLLFSKHRKVFEELIKTFRLQGAEAVKEKSSEFLMDPNLFKDIHEVMKEGGIFSEVEFDTAVRLLKEKMQEGLLTTYFNEYFDKKARGEEASIKDLIQKLQTMEQSLNAKKVKSLKERKEEILQAFRERKPVFELPSIGIPVYPSDVVLISAPPKDGKTTYAANIIAELLKIEQAQSTEQLEKNEWQGYKILVFTYEMPSEVLISFIIAIHQGKPVKEVTAEEIAKFIEDYNDRLNIIENVDLDTLLDIVWIEHPDVFIVDYDQLVPVKDKFPTEERRVAYIANSLKSVSMQTKSVCVLLSQVNEDGKARYSREKEFVASVHIHLQREKDKDTGIPTNPDFIDYTVRYNRWGKAGDTGKLFVDWEKRKIGG